MPSTGAEKLRQQGVHRKRELEARNKRELRVARDKRRAGDLITKALSEANELQDTNSQLRSQLQGIRMQSEAAEAHVPTCFLAAVILRHVLTFSVVLK